MIEKQKYLSFTEGSEVQSIKGKLILGDGDKEPKKQCCLLKKCSSIVFSKRYVFTRLPLDFSGRDAGI